MNNQINIGTTFKVNAKIYSKFTFTVTKIAPELTYDVTCIDQNGDTMCFSTKQLEGYGVTILSAPAFDADLLMTATAQGAACAALYEDGPRVYAAYQKARTEIEENGTIKTENGVVSFLSRTSGKKRFITMHGCSDFCDCKNGLSYHRAIFDILRRYDELETAAKVRPFPARVRQTRKAA